MLFDITQYIKTQINGIIQIGAHHGNEYETLKKLSENILMFEPQKKVYEKLFNKLGSFSNVIIENKALGSSRGTMIMYTEQANGGQSSSLLVPQLHCLQYPGITFNGTEEVEVITLNEYFTNKVFNYNLITLDVQGYELEVLKGSSDLLLNVDYILCEVNRAELYKDCPMVEDIDKFLNNYGFIREITSWDGGTWGDALYVRTNVKT
jgi:FkbM family methyltransferase